MPRPRGAGSGPPGGEPPAAALRQEWQRLHGIAASAAASQDFLRRDIAYRLQAGQGSGLSAATRRRLASLASGDLATSPQPRTPTLRIKPGSTLLREWQGRTYTVLALEAGFEMAGQRFASLSEVEQGISQSYATRLVRLAWLAPDIVEAILGGCQPPNLTASRLMRDTRIPTDWQEQRRALGFI